MPRLLPTRLLAALLAHVALAACTASLPPGGGGDAAAATDAGLDALPGGSDLGGCGAGAPDAPGLVRTDRGPVQGNDVGGAWRYLGIPYAAPPVGALRWKPPADTACEPTVRAADRYGSICPQLGSSDEFLGAEDCLTLNVWTPKAGGAPAPAGGRPVMVFLHGGGHVQGSSAVEAQAGRPLYDGTRYAVEHGVVVVTINYRLGVFGYLAHAALAAESPDGLEGNYGTLDQIAALRYVRRNAAAFGGDPARVTIFGESAGAVSVCTLLATPLAKGLFTGAIMESGGCAAMTRDRAETLAARVVTGAGCDGSADVPACLRALSTEAAVRAYPVKPDVAGIGSLGYGSVIDGYVHAEPPLAVIQRGAHNHAALVVGSNAQETSRTVPAIATDAAYRTAVLALAGGNQTLADAVLALYPSADYLTPRAAMVALTTDAKFICSARLAARAAAAGQTEPVYRYQFAQPLEAAPMLRPLGAWHGIELFWVFGVLDVAGYMPTAGEVALSAEVQGYWARFAATADPNGAGAVAWPRYEPVSDPYLNLRAGATVAGAGLRAKYCDFWDSLR